MSVKKNNDKYIKKKSIKTIGLSSLAFLFLLLAFVILDNVYEKEVKIINHSDGDWFIISIVSFIVSLIVAFLLYIIIGDGKKVHKFFLYLFTLPISMFIFSAVNCSGGLYSPFLSLYALIFTGAIIITDSPKAIIFMIILVMLGIFLHLSYNTQIVIEKVNITTKTGESYIESCSTLLNNEIYQIKYAIILGIVFLEMMLAELFNFLYKEQVENNVKEA